MSEAMRRAAEAQILRVMLDAPDLPCYGYDLMQATHQSAATLYPALTGLWQEGLLIRGREPAADAIDRPPRISYRLKPCLIDDARLRVMALHLHAT